MPLDPLDRLSHLLLHAHEHEGVERVDESQPHPKGLDALLLGRIDLVQTPRVVPVPGPRVRKRLPHAPLPRRLRHAHCRWLRHPTYVIPGGAAG